MIFKNMEECKNPVPPYAKNNDSKLTITIYSKNNKTIIKGTWMSKEDLRGYFWRFKYGRQKSGVIKYSFEYDRISCRNIIPKLLLLATHVRYDAKSCVIHKGTYAFDDLDLTAIDKGTFVFPIRELGESVMLFSYYGPGGTVYCFTMVTEYL